MSVLNSNFDSNLLIFLILVHIFFLKLPFSEISFFGGGGSEAQRLKDFYQPRVIFNTPGWDLDDQKYTSSPSFLEANSNKVGTPA